MTELGVNIDHVATVRQARRTWEPDPVEAALEAQLGGADGITVHLREDRRHIQDEDVRRLRETISLRLNFEMAATPEMVGFACSIRPEMAMMVPEGRQEVTTEGGLDVRGAREDIAAKVAEIRSAGISVSAFIDPDLRQVEAAAACGFQVCEVHTGPFAHAFKASHGDLEDPATSRALADVATAGEAIRAAGMRFNAGHALNYDNVRPIATLPGLWELHIGHSIVSRSIFVGLRSAVREMKCILDDVSPQGGSIQDGS